MNRIMIMSPHPDDVFLSLGASIIKGNEKTMVCDIFNVQEYSVLKESKEVARKRIIEEEKEVSKQAGVQLKMYDFPEAGLRGYKRLSQILNYKFDDNQLICDERGIYQQIILMMHNEILEFKPQWVGIPLGCGKHIDHIIVREAILNLYKRIQNEHKFKIFLYEDLPYSLEQKWLSEACEEYRKRNMIIKERLLPVDDEILKKKKQMISLYKSQLRKRDVNHIITYSKKLHEIGYNERIWIFQD